MCVCVCVCVRARVRALVYTHSAVCVSYILTDLIFMNYELDAIITLFPF